jgi:hypothetical protein
MQPPSGSLYLTQLRGRVKLGLGLLQLSFPAFAFIHARQRITAP